MLLDIFNSKEVNFHWIKDPYSWVGHFPFSYWLVSTIKPSIIVELGTHIGNSFFCFCQSVKDHHLNCECYAVDTWSGDEQAGYYGEEIYQMVNDYLNSQYSSIAHLFRMTFDQAQSLFRDKKINILHIDGLHTYEAVKHDFETWLPCMAEGGIILLHDISVKKQGFGVFKLWKELTNLYPYHLSFNHSHGLGIIQISAHPHLGWYSWLHPESDAKHIIQKYFTAVGSALYYEKEKMRIENLLEKIQTERDLIFTERELYHNRLTLLERSISWRITKPLRIIESLITKNVPFLRGY